MNTIREFLARFGIKAPFDGLLIYVALWVFSWLLLAVGVGAAIGGGLLMWWVRGL